MFSVYIRERIEYCTLQHHLQYCGVITEPCETCFQKIMGYFIIGQAFIYCILMKIYYYFHSINVPIGYFYPLLPDR